MPICLQGHNTTEIRKTIIGLNLNTYLCNIFFLSSLRKNNTNYTLMPDKYGYIDTLNRGKRPTYPIIILFKGVMIQTGSICIHKILKGVHPFYSAEHCSMIPVSFANVSIRFN